MGHFETLRTTRWGEKRAVQTRAARSTGHAVRRALGLGALSATAAVTLLASSLTLSPAEASATTAPDDDTTSSALYLVTLNGPGTTGSPLSLPDAVLRADLTDQQDAVLTRAGLSDPVYRWTTALNGMALRLTPREAAQVTADPDVAQVEPDTVRPLAGHQPTASSLGASTPTSPDLVDSGRRRGGAGTVIGIVDTGIEPGRPLFAPVPGLGRRATSYSGACQQGQDWPADTCSGKIAGASWFVDGFGADRVRVSTSLSARDDDGHGTQMASVAAGNAGVDVRVRGQRLGSYAGLAPQARLAIYKACWTAPDPADDGCSTADLVSAVDRATSDGVDVLNLSVGGPSSTDTLERALLGAAEAGTVVVAAAGNDIDGTDGTAAHPGPWMTTVGGTTGERRRGRIDLSTGPTLTGAMASVRPVGPAKLVVGADAAAAGSSRAAARVCTPGSLDAAAVAGRIVLCDRGLIGRVDKSAAVLRADGVGMVLANVVRGSTDADVHSVPTVHLDRVAGHQLSRWHTQHPGGLLTLRPLGVDGTTTRVLGYSRAGSPNAGVLKPDLVAPATGVLGAVPLTTRGVRWDFVSGTSAATAYTSGLAAVLSSRGWSASVVRSALATTAERVRGASVLRTGAGRPRLEQALEPGLVYDVRPGDYRAWLDGTLPTLNTPSLVLAPGRRTATRTVTNVGQRALYFSSSATGFARHRVQVTPAALRLGPGESGTYRVTVSGRRSGALDDGFVTWRGATGTVTRIPVLLR